MYRWTARFALLVMLVPSFGPLAQAAIAPAAKMQCCVRRPPAAPDEPRMHCHHGALSGGQEAAAAQDLEPSEASFRPLDCCGQRCDCCRNSKTSEWTHLASRHPSVVGLHIEPVAGASTAAHVSAPLIDADSARAPPHS